jgi:gluconate 5-dehydrogenase
VLVNNAGFFAMGNLTEISEEQWLAGIDGSLNGVFRCLQAGARAMLPAQSGSIINIASMYGVVSPDPSIYGSSGQDNPPNYGTGKAAIIQLTRYAACHLGRSGIRVNAISPGPFPKPQVQQNRDLIANLEAKTALGRIGQPHELKGAVVFLASAAASYVTGINLMVDGGWTAW